MRSGPGRLLVFLSVFLLPCSALAHNGAVALAFPVEGIVVDGDFSDWPEELPRYPITHTEAGVPPRNPEDLSASFQIGYNTAEKALYVAVDVVDESVFIDSSQARNWNTEDGCEVYIGLDHADEASTRQFILRGNGTLNQRAGADGAELVRWRRDENGHRYEWRMRLPELFEASRLQGVAIAADVVVCDKDADGSFTWMAWGARTYKVRVLRIGDVVLSETPAAVGRVTGRAVRQGTGRAIRGVTVSFARADDTEQSIRLQTDREGRFAASLPPGLYDATLAWGHDRGIQQQVEIPAAATVELVFDAGPTAGIHSEAGPGKRVRVGDGRRSQGWHTLTTLDGLPDDIRDLFQNDDGTLWIGTSAGLVRYDGQHFTIYTTEDGLPADMVFSVARGTRGHLWVGTGAGLVRYDGESFTSYDTQDGLIHQRIAAIVPLPDGGLWLATDAGLSHFDGEHFSNWTSADGLPGDRVVALTEDDAGDLWIGTPSGLARYDGTTFESFTEASGLIGTDIRCLYKADDGMVWIGSTMGLSRYDGRQDVGHRFTNIGVDDGLIYQRVDGIAEDGDGNLWVGCTEQAGGDESRFYGALFRYDARQDVGHRFQPFHLSGSPVAAMLLDREGNLWVGKETELSRLDAGRFDLLTESDGLLSSVITSMAEDELGDIWIGTEAGLNSWNGREFTNYTVADGLPQNRVSGLLADEDGTLWVTFYGGGLCKRRDEGFECLTAADGLPADILHSPKRAVDGSLWMASNGAGAIRYDGRRPVGDRFTSLGTAQGLPNNVIGSVLPTRDGNVWIGAWEAGVHRFDGEELSSFTTREGLAGNEVIDILEDSRGQLWFATLNSGISRYDARQDVGSDFSSFDTRDGLINRRVTRILEDRRGAIWFTTLGGISRFDGTVFQGLTQREGLPGGRTERLLEDRHGRIWIGLPEAGLLRYTPRAVAPIVSITDVIGEKRMGPVSEIAVPTTLPRLIFEFHAISFRTRPEAMIYRYRLVGHHDDWRQADGEHIEYEDLPRGEYVFEVTAVDRDLNYSEEPARVDVVVHLPYPRIALWSLLGLALAGLAWQGRQLVVRNRTLKDRTATAEEALHDLKQTQAQLVQSEKMASLGVLTAGIAHEINNPVNFIRTGIQALKRNLTDLRELLDEYGKVTPDNATDALEEIEGLKEEVEYDELITGIDQLTANITTGADRTTEIVKGLRTFSRLDEGKQKPVDLHENIDSTLMMLHSRYRDSIHICKEYGEIPSVACHAGQLNQVFMNVLANAIDAIEGKGEKQSDEEIRIRTFPVERDGRAFVCVEIADSGPGIPQEVQDQLFEPFFTTKEVGEGTGLGLSISHGIVEDHGGTIEVASEMGVGTTFRISLPV